MYLCKMSSNKTFSGKHIFVPSIFVSPFSATSSSCLYFLVFVFCLGNIAEEWKFFKYYQSQNDDEADDTIFSK